MNKSLQTSSISSSKTPSDMQIKHQKRYKVSLLDIFQGKSITVELKSKQYSISLKSMKHMTETYEIDGTRVIIECQQDETYRREGDDLIVNFNLSQNCKHQLVSFPHLDPSIQFQSIQLDSQQYKIENYGFYHNDESDNRGNYIIYITFH